MITLLEATTEAATSKQFTIAGRRRPVTFLAPGLASAETATVQFWSGTDWVDTALKLTATNPILKHDGPLVARIKKSATVAAVPIRAVTDVHHAGFSIEGMFAGGIEGLYLDLSVGSTVFKDTDGTLLADPGDKIALITDLSGNGNHGTQRVKDKRATYTGQNIQFFGDDVHLDLGSLALTAAAGTYTYILDYETVPGDVSGILLGAKGSEFMGAFAQGSGIAQLNSNFVVTSIHVDGVLETPTTRGDFYDIVSSGSGRHWFIMQFTTPNPELPYIGFFPEPNGGPYSLEGRAHTIAIINKALTAGEREEISKL